MTGYVPFNQWIGKWWQWYVSVPKTESPNHPDYPNHISKVDCAIRQEPSSPVFFLFTPLVDEPSPERTCDVPKDKAILIPIISAEADNGDPEQTDKSEQGLIQTAKAGNDNGAISIKLDNTKLNFNEDPKFRAMSDFFNITLPEHNLWEEKEVPGTYKGITEGYFLLLNRLMKFISFQLDRVKKGEISDATVPNYYKAVKLFCEMNDLTLSWKKISKGLPNRKMSANDRACSSSIIIRL